MSQILGPLKFIGHAATAPSADCEYGEILKILPEMLGPIKPPTAKLPYYFQMLKWRWNVRVFSFVAASAFGAALTFPAPSEPVKPEPSETQMESSFGDFLSKLETKPVSQIQFSAFRKRSCKPFASKAGYYCDFNYSTGLPAQEFFVLPTSGTVSGTFYTDDAGELKFEMVIG